MQLLRHGGFTQGEKCIFRNIGIGFLALIALGMIHSAFFPDMTPEPAYVDDSMIAKDGHISTHVGKERAKILREVIISSGYSCPTVFTANRLFMKPGFNISCKSSSGYYDYDIVDRGGTWVVFLR